MNTASAEHGFTNANIIFDKIKDIGSTIRTTANK